MRFGRLTPESLQPLAAGGAVTLWQVSPQTCRAMAAAPHDPRRASPDQVARVLDHLARPPRPDGAAPWIGIGRRLPSAGSQRVAATLSRFVDRHEALRSRLDPATGGLERRTLAPGRTDFVVAAAHEVGDPVELCRVVTGWWDECAQVGLWPNLGAVCVDDGETSTLLLAFEHLVFDGVSAYLSLADLAATHEAVLSGAPPGPPAASHVDSAHRSALLGDDVAAHPGFALWQARAAEVGRRAPLPPRPTAVPEGSATGAMGSLPVVDTATLDLVGALAHDHGVALPLLVLVLVEEALEEECGTVHPFLVATHNRTREERVGSVGWYAGVAPYPGTDHGASPLERARLLGERWREVVAAGQLQVPAVAAALGAPIGLDLVVSFLDVRAFPGAQQWSPTTAATWAGPARADGTVHLWLMCSSEELVLEWRCPDGPSFAPWREAVATRLRLSLTRLAHDRAGAPPCR